MLRSNAALPHTNAKLWGGVGEIGNRKSEIGNWKSEMGDRRWEIGNRKSEIGKTRRRSPISDCGRVAAGRFPISADRRAFGAR
jgi:hypothetical protein